MIMCFSATASFVAGGALVAVGGLTVAQTKKRSELAFASIPLLFGIQQIIEGVLWLSFGYPTLNIIMTYAYSMFSHVFWPFFLPLSILLLEKDKVRKIILWLFFGVGSAVALYLLYFIVDNTVTSHTVNHSIAYVSPGLYPLWVTTFYVVVTCGSAILSKYKIINLFGIVLFISFFVAGYFFNETFFSVWCFISAILSIFVYLHLRYQKSLS